MAIRSGDVMTVAPGADDVIREDDVLVVIGRNDRLQRFRKA
jgi:trk system potassium uptake protein TrkA